MCPRKSREIHNNTTTCYPEKIFEPLQRKLNSEFSLSSFPFHGEPNAVPYMCHSLTYSPATIEILRFAELEIEEVFTSVSMAHYLGRNLYT